MEGSVDEEQSGQTGSRILWLRVNKEKAITVNGMRNYG